MAVYAVGDVQGCYEELRLLLDKLNFDPAADRLWLVGDLVNRGPASLETLRLVYSLGNAAVTVLGNHDLHLLALARSSSASKIDHSLQPVLDAPDCNELIEWLRHLPLAHYDSDLQTLMVHAGVDADWSLPDTLNLAHEVESVLGGHGLSDFLDQMYGPKPERWSPELTGTDRLRFIVNCCTRMRYCRPDGSLDFSAKLGPDQYTGAKAEKLQPWFRRSDRKIKDTRIVFGHWSTLGFLKESNVVALDTGCVWGGKLTAVRLDRNSPVIQIESRQPDKF